MPGWGNNDSEFGSGDKPVSDFGSGDKEWGGNDKEAASFPKNPGIHAVELAGGKIALVPTRDENGRDLSLEEAGDQYWATGNHIGVYNSPQEATKAAQAWQEQSKNAPMAASHTPSPRISNLKNPLSGNTQINPVAERRQSLGSAVDLAMWPENLYQNLNQATVGTGLKAASVATELSQRLDEATPQWLRTVGSKLSGGRVKPEDWDKPSAAAQTTKELVDANEAALRERINTLQGYGVDPESAVGQVSGFIGNAQGVLTQLALTPGKAGKAVLSAQATVSSLDRNLRDPQVSTAMALGRAGAEGLLTYGVMSIPGADKFKSAMQARGAGAAWEAFSSESPTIYKNVLTKIGSKLGRGVTIGAALTETNQLLDKAFIDHKLPWTPEWAQFKKSAAEMIAWEAIGGVMSGKKDLAKNQPVKIPTVESTPEPTPPKIELNVDGIKPPLDSTGSKIEIGEVPPPRKPAPLENPISLEPPKPETELVPAKNSDKLASTQGEQQDAITQLRRDRVTQMRDVDAAQARLDQLHVEGRRGKSSEWVEANKNLEDAKAKLAGTEKELEQNTGKTVEEMGWEDTRLAWEDLKSSLEAPGSKEGVSNLGANLPMDKVINLVKAAAKDGYRNAAEWLADMRTKMGEDFKEFYRSIGGLKGANDLWNEHNLGLKPGEASRPVNPDSREFQQWSKGTEFKDESGKPTQFYHGTLDEFDGFSPSRRGIFLSTDPAFASKFGQGNGGRVIPAYVKSSKSFDYSKPENVADFNAWVEAKNRKNEFHNGEPTPDVEAGNWSVMESRPFQQFLKENGYDAYFVKENGVRNLAVMDPSQIKSSLTNTGDYSSTSGRIVDNLGLQQMYEAGMNKAKEKLGLDPRATDGDVVRAVGERLGSLGKTAKETAVKIMNQIEGIGRDLADAIAKHLHEAVSGSRESQRGVIGKDIRDKGPSELPLLADKSPNAELRTSVISEADKLGLHGKDKADFIAKGMTSGKPSVVATEAAKIIGNGGLPIVQREKAFEQTRQSISKGIVPNGNELIKQKGNELGLKDWLNAVTAGYSGGGLYTESGAKQIIRPFMDYDPKSAADSARRDLNLAEKIHGRLGSPSHTYTTFGGWVKGEAGAMDFGNNPATDIRIAEGSSFGNNVSTRTHLEAQYKDLGIDYRSKEVTKDLAESRERLAKAHADYERANKNLSTGTDEAVSKARLSQAEAELRIANGIVQGEIKNLAADPLNSGVRTLLAADALGRGKELPEWLAPHLKENERKAAQVTIDQLGEIKRAMKEEGIPFREEDFGVPHLFTSGLKKSTIKSLRDVESLSGELSLDPEKIKFMHRGENSVVTIPDLGLIVDDYIPRVTYMLSKKAVADKWNKAAADIDASGKPDLADKIRRDIKDYAEGNRGQHEWLDQVNRVYANFLVGFRTATSVKHGMKFPLEMAHGRPIYNAKGYIEYRKAAFGDPDIKRVLKALTTISKGPRYNKNPDIGTGEAPLDRPTTMMQEFENMSHFPMQAVEGGLRGVTFKFDLLGAYKRGLSPQEAIADTLFRKLMANFEATDKPVLLRSPLGRSVFFLQQTVTKIAELNMRSTMDAAKGVTRQASSLLGGAPVGKAEAARHMQAYRHMMALATVYAIGKATNTPIFEWVTESPTIAKLITNPLKEFGRYLLAQAQGEKFKSKYSFGQELYSGLPPVLPAASKVLESSKKYGVFNKAFATDVAMPGFLQDVVVEPKGPQTRKWGRGEEGRLRKFLGLYKEEEALKLEEKQHSNLEKRQKNAVKRRSKQLSPGPR